MIWKQPATLENVNAFSRNTLLEQLSIEFTQIGDDFLVGTMPVDNRTKQPLGLLHGGASVALAESLGSTASLLCIEDPMKYHPVGVEINANHLRPATKGKVTGTVRPVKVGRRIHVWEIKIENEENKLVCVSRLTVAIVEAAK